MFANQVEDFCEFSDMHNCNRELLKFGLGKLKDMPEDHLDTMDPYQRGAHTLSKCLFPFKMTFIITTRISMLTTQFYTDR